MPFHFYWFCCVARFWNSLLKSNNALLSRIAHRKESWTFEVLSALCGTLGAKVHTSAIMSCSKINMSDFELLLREQTIKEWGGLDQIHPHDTHVSGRDCMMLLPPIHAPQSPHAFC